MSAKSSVSKKILAAILVFLAAITAVTTVTVLTAVTAIIPAAPAYAAESLVNPSFEEVEPSGKAIGWDQTSYNTDSGVSEFSITDEQAHSGKKSAKIVNNSENDSRFVQNFKIKENTNYKVSCWIMASGIGEQGAGAVLSIGNQLETTRKIGDTNGEWQYTEMYVKVGTGRRDMNITVGIGGYSSLCTGTAYFDDVSVEVVNEIPQGSIVALIGDMNDANGNSHENNPSPNEDESTVRERNALYLACLVIASVLLSGAALYFLKKGQAGIDVDGKNGFFDDDIEDDIEIE